MVEIQNWANQSNIKCTDTHTISLARFKGFQSHQFLLRVFVDNVLKPVSRNFKHSTFGHGKGTKNSELWKILGIYICTVMISEVRFVNFF